MCCIYRFRRFEKLIALLAIIALYLLIISQLHLSDDAMKKVKKYLDTNDVFDRNSVEEIRKEIVQIGNIANVEIESRKELLEELSRGDLGNVENEYKRERRTQRHDDLKNLENESRKEILKDVKQAELVNVENESRKEILKDVKQAELVNVENESRKERLKDLKQAELVNVENESRKMMVKEANSENELRKDILKVLHRSELTNHKNDSSKIMVNSENDSRKEGLKELEQGELVDFKVALIKSKKKMTEGNLRTFTGKNQSIPKSFINENNTDMIQNHKSWNRSDDNAAEKNKVHQVTPSVYSFNHNLRNESQEFIKTKEIISQGSVFHSTMSKQTRETSFDKRVTTIGLSDNINNYKKNDDNQSQNKPKVSISSSSPFRPTMTQRPLGTSFNKRVAKTGLFDGTNSYKIHEDNQTRNVSDGNEKRKNQTNNITSSAFPLDNEKSNTITEPISNVTYGNTFQPTKPLLTRSTIRRKHVMTDNNLFGDGDVNQKNRNYQVRNTSNNKERRKNETNKMTSSTFSLGNNASKGFSGSILDFSSMNISYPTKTTYKKVTTKTHHPKHGLKRAKLLLLYTPMFGRIPWRSTPYDYTFTEIDYKTPCPINNCRVTYNKTRIYESDAVYFHGRDLPSSKDLRELRRKVDKKQIWIWFMHESPEFTYYNSKDEYDGIFNWTSTYSPKSEIFIPYFGIRKLKNNERKTKTENFANGKDKMVLFINSHCDALRMNFIRRFKKYVQVDVYGRCKNMINPELPDCPRNSDKCRKIQSRYKFYLAIENSFCEDYVTEKYYKNAMQRGIVPLIMGGADYNDSRIVLPHSFINIRNYKNLKQLGNYLNYLNSNNTAYNEYFEWTKDYIVELQHGMCKACKALWEHNESESKVVNLSEFWNSSSKCLDKEKIISNYV